MEGNTTKEHKLLAEYGFSLPRGGVAQSAEEAVRIATEIGFPVALKVLSPDIVHKTEVGGVKLGVSTPAEMKQAYADLMRSVSAGAPQAAISGVQVEEMCRGGAELFVGLQHNPQLGPTIAFGLGGVFTELFKDVTFRLLPISEDDAAQMITEIRGREILQGYRGATPVSNELMVRLLMAAAKLGLDHAHSLEAVDLNPILVWGDEHRVLDAKILFSAEGYTTAVEEPNTCHLDGFFEAQSVAIVGASGTPGKIGHAILESLSRHQYRGHVYPVNPQRPEILGMKAFPSLREIPASVDLAVVAVPLRHVPALVAECGEKGVRNMVIVSGGGKESGQAGKQLEEEIASRAREAGVRIVGPNCIGVFNGENQLDTFFQPHDKMDRPRAGRVAVLSQSGTVGVGLLERFAELGVSKFVSYGNRLDVDEADLIAYLGEDPQTDVIVCYFEGLENGRKLFSAIRDVTPRTPVVVFKSGRTPQGARASISHTGFFGGTYEPWKGALLQAGAVAVDGFEELAAAAKALLMQPPAGGNRVAMISNGAGPMVQAMDLLSDYDLQLKELSQDAIDRLKERYPDYFMVQNPLDVTGSATAKDYDVGLRGLLSEEDVDIVLAWFVFQDAPLDLEIVDVLRALGEEQHKPILCGAMGGTWTKHVSERIEQAGIPVVQSVREWLSGAAALARYGRVVRG